MTLGIQILAVIDLDLLWCDLRSLPHPVKGIGRLAGG